MGAGGAQHFGPTEDEVWEMHYKSLHWPRYYITCSTLTPSLFNCDKCGSDLVRHTSAQIARADEAETVFLTCFNCDHKWALDRGF